MKTSRLMQGLCSGVLALGLLLGGTAAWADFAADLAAGVPLQDAVEQALQNGETLDAIAAAAQAAGVDSDELAQALVDAGVRPLLVRNALVGAGYPEDEVVAYLVDAGYSLTGPATRELGVSTYSGISGAGGGGAVVSPN